MYREAKRINFATQQNVEKEKKKDIIVTAAA